jgi:tRNA(Ile2) C34 agmatinyltransferase TiaS
LTYLIVVCKYCNTPRYVREGEKSFKCLKCGSYIELGEAKVAAKVQTIKDAIYVVKELKLPEELRNWGSLLNTPTTPRATCSAPRRSSSPFSSCSRSP